MREKRNEIEGSREKEKGRERRTYCTLWVIVRRIL